MKLGRLRRALRVCRQGEILLLLGVPCGVTSCAFNVALRPAISAAPEQAVLHDAARNRDVPVLLYSDARARSPLPLAVLSHGYGVDADEYRIIAGEMVRRGYLVASIRHLELPGDPPMVNAGDLARLRRPVWQVGADTIVFVIRELQRRGRADTRRVVAVGHSNGGDMTMLLATTRPELLERAISLDNRRMPVPRTRSPAICTIRSADQVADPDVLPSPEDARRFRITVIPTRVRHNDMGDAADAVGRAELLAALGRCLAVPVEAAPPRKTHSAR